MNQENWFHTSVSAYEPTKSVRLKHIGHWSQRLTDPIWKHVFCVLLTLMYFFPSGFVHDVFISKQIKFDPPDHVFGSGAQRYCWRNGFCSPEAIIVIFFFVISFSICEDILSVSLFVTKQCNVLPNWTQHCSKLHSWAKHDTKQWAKRILPDEQTEGTRTRTGPWHLCIWGVYGWWQKGRTFAVEESAKVLLSPNKLKQFRANAHKTIFNFC